MMTHFDRSFAAPEDAWADHPGVRHLFAAWALPGESSSRYGLRIGLRRGYLNLYVKGQSVAKLSTRRGRPRIEVHPKYYAGLAKKPGRSELLSQRSVKVDADDITPDAIDRWIKTAETYASAEKRFVDDLITANAGVIDLEVGLPGKSAPRIDLALVQHAAGATQIAFWEAKCSNNKELRARVAYSEGADHEYLTGIPVIHQIRKYQRWMTPVEQQRVGDAYRRAADLLDRLAARFEKVGRARSMWRAVADALETTIVLPPAVVVGNYCPASHVGKRTRSDEDHFAHLATSFGRFRTVIETHGVRVHEVAGAAASELPLLVAGEAKTNAI